MSAESRSDQTPTLPQGTRVLLDPRNPRKIGFVFAPCGDDALDAQLTAVTQWAAYTFGTNSVHLEGIAQRVTRYGDPHMKAVIVLG